MHPATKIIKTIESCKTSAHIESTRNLIRNYERMHGVTDLSVELRNDLKIKQNEIEKNPIRTDYR